MGEIVCIKHGTAMVTYNDAITGRNQTICPECQMKPARPLYIIVNRFSKQAISCASSWKDALARQAEAGGKLAAEIQTM